MGELLHTARVGDADETVVFLHGLFGQGKNFQTIARGLEPEHGSLLVDLPNHGESAWTDRVDYAQMADAVAETIRAQVRGAGADDGSPGGSITPVHVVGHSMGGKVAMLLALRHPELVARLVVVDISPAGANGTGEFEHLLGALATLDLEALTSRADADAALTELIPNRTVRGFLLQNLRREGDGWRWRANLDLLRASLDVIAGFPGTRRASFDGPVLWVAGDRSDYVRPEHAPTMRALFPRVRQLTVKGSGHWVHSEQPDVFIQALRVFLGQG
ncbi:MAG: alpha/beta fold hydrolase [Actinomycetales bacterium]|nr:alpha/beta fold hydrolase [Actinomycetales bacterium]